MAFDEGKSVLKNYLRPVNKNSAALLKRNAVFVCRNTVYAYRNTLTDENIISVGNQVAILINNSAMFTKNSAILEKNTPILIENRSTFAKNSAVVVKKNPVLNQISNHLVIYSPLFIISFVQDANPQLLTYSNSGSFLNFPLYAVNKQNQKQTQEVNVVRLSN